MKFTVLLFALLAPLHWAIGQAQESAVPSQGNWPGQPSNPALIKAPRPGDATTASGPYQSVFRLAKADNFGAWQPDSLWRKETYLGMVVNSQSRNLLQSVVQYSYETQDSLLKEVHYIDERYGMDTLSVYSTYTNQRWVPYFRYRTSISPERVVILGEDLKVTTGWTARNRAIKKYDSQGRLVLDCDSSYDAATATWRVANMYTYTYVGNTDLAAAEWRHAWSPTTQATHLMAHVDSITYDAADRQISQVNKMYRTDGSLAARYFTQSRYNGDSAFTTQWHITYMPGNPPALSTLNWGYSITSGDSVKAYAYEMRNGQYQLYGYSLSRSHDPNQADDWDYEWLSYNEGGGGTYNLGGGGKVETMFNAQSLPQRKLQYNFSLGLSRLKLALKFDYEYFAPQLMPVRKSKAGSALALAPNPAGNQLTINSEHPIDRLILTDALGRRHTVLVESGRASIAHLPPGLYHAAAFSNGKLLDTSRLIKQ